MQLTVIIVSYNVRPLLLQCLYALQHACLGLAAEILVVDNASSDGTVASLQRHFPHVQFIQSKQNLGFARANNLALQQARGQYILFLNPDTLVPENCLHNCILHLKQHSTTGAVGVQMIDGNGVFLPESKRSKPSITASFFKLSGLASAFPHSGFFNRYALGRLNKHNNCEVDVLAGAFMLIRKSVLENVGGFHEDYFMFGEDIDLCIRIQKAGYRIMYLGKECIIHHKGQSLPRGSAQHTQLFYQAMLIYVRNHYRLPFLLYPFIHIMRQCTLLRNKFTKSKQRYPETPINHATLVMHDAKPDAKLERLLHDNGIEHIEMLPVEHINQMQGRTNTGYTIFVLPDVTLEAASRYMQANQNKPYLFITRTPSSISFNT